MSFRFSSLLLFSFSCIVLAQQVQIGAVAGTNRNDAFSALDAPSPPPGSSAGTFEYRTGKRQFIVGPKVEVYFTKNLSIEANALFRQLKPEVRLRQPGLLPPIPFELSSRSNWEFPILGKYTAGSGPLRPFVEGGMSFRTVRTGSGMSTRGATAGVGLDTRWGPLSIQPTLRYTRWTESRIGPIPQPRQDQLEFLVGFNYLDTEDFARRALPKLSIGVLAGANLGRDVNTPPPFSGGRVVSDEYSPAWGLGIEHEVYKQLSIEADAFYRPLRFTYLPEVSIPGFRGQRRATTTWEVPVLAKVRLSSGNIRPFLQAGPSFRFTSNRNTDEPSNFGITGGAGFEWSLGPFKMGPQFRYTRWQETRSSPFDVRIRNDQSQLLFGIFF